ENAEADGGEGEENAGLRTQQRAAQGGKAILRGFQPRRSQLCKGRPRACAGGRCPRHPFPPECSLKDLRIPANPPPESQLSVHTIANRLSSANKPFGFINFPRLPFEHTRGTFLHVPRQRLVARDALQRLARLAPAAAFQ